MKKSDTQVLFARSSLFYSQKQWAAVTGSESGHVDNDGQGSEAGHFIRILCFGFGGHKLALLLTLCRSKSHDSMDDNAGVNAEG